MASDVPRKYVAGTPEVSHAATGAEFWPCGCAKGMTPHGVGWRDCIFSDDQKEKWAKLAEQIAADEREHAERREADWWKERERDDE